METEKCKGKANHTNFYINYFTQREWGNKLSAIHKNKLQWSNIGANQLFYSISISSVPKLYFSNRCKFSRIMMCNCVFFPSLVYVLVEYLVVLPFLLPLAFINLIKNKEDRGSPCCDPFRSFMDLGRVLLTQILALFIQNFSPPYGFLFIFLNFFFGSLMDLYQL